MKLTIEITMDNAAFEDDAQAEIDRLLDSVKSRLPEPMRDTNGACSLHDSNGNHVGTFEITD